MATNRANRQEQGGTDPNKADVQKGKARRPQPQPRGKAPQEPATEVSKPDPRKTEESKPKRKEVPPELLNEDGQYLGKYAERQKRADEAGVGYDPNWRYRDTVIVTGTPPNSETSVMGQMYKIAKEAGKEGITGKDLVLKLRHTPNIASRSPYTIGLPPVGWCEDYVNGGLTKSPAALRIAENQPKKQEEKESEES